MIPFSPSPIFHCPLLLLCTCLSHRPPLSIGPHSVYGSLLPSPNTGIPVLGLGVNGRHAGLPRPHLSSCLPFPLVEPMTSRLLPGQPLRCLREASESIPLGPWYLSSKLKSLIATQTEALEAEQERVEGKFSPNLQDTTQGQQPPGATQGSTCCQAVPTGDYPEWGSWQLVVHGQLWSAQFCSENLVFPHLIFCLTLTFFSSWWNLQSHLSVLTEKCLRSTGGEKEAHKVKWHCPTAC